MTQEPSRGDTSQVKPAFQPNNYLYLNYPLSTFTLQSPLALIQWDDVSKEIVIINDRRVDILPVYSNAVHAIFLELPLMHNTPLPTHVSAHSKSDSAIKQAKVSPQRLLLATNYNNKQIIIFSVANQARDIVAAYEVKDQKNRKTTILGFYWIDESNILLVTTTSIEVLTFTTKNKLMKPVKTFYDNIRFYEYNPETGIAVTAVEGKPGYLFPYSMNLQTKGMLSKLDRFSLEIQTGEPNFEQSEIYLVLLYGKCCCAFLSSSRQEMLIFRFKDTTFTKHRVFNLFSPGNFALSIVDSLIIVHNTDDKLSMAYDIFTKQDAPVCPPMSIAPYSSYTRDETRTKSPEPSEVELYSSPWRYIHPNIIIDTKGGFLFELHISLNEMPISIRSKTDMIKFLFRRLNSKFVLLRMLKSFIDERRESLTSVSTLLGIINRYYLNILIRREKEKKKKQTVQMSTNRLSLRLIKPSQIPVAIGAPIGAISPQASPSQEEVVMQEDAPPLPTEEESGTGSEETLIVNSLGYPVVEQVDIYTHVLHPIDEEKSIDTLELIPIVVEYIRSLKNYRIPVQHFIQKFLIELLVKAQELHLLHSFVQYKVISDSRPTALQILSISAEYKPGYQIALDMMSRLQAYDLICEIFLSRGQFSQALQTMHRYSISNIPPKVIFETILATNDQLMFFNAYEILRKINLKNRGDPSFLESEECAQYDKLFAENFLPQVTKKPGTNSNPSSPTRLAEEVKLN